MSTTSDLNPSDYNPRNITPERLDLLRRQLAEFGDLSGIVFNVRTSRLVGGHQRISALEDSWPISRNTYSDETGTVAIGHIDTPYGRFNYREVDWSDEKEKLANLAANNPAGTFDKDKVGLVLMDLPDQALALTGFGEIELQKFKIDNYLDDPEVKEWDLSDIDEPFWIVIRGPIRRFNHVRDLLRGIEHDGVIVEASL